VLGSAPPLESFAKLGRNSAQAPEGASAYVLNSGGKFNLPPPYFYDNILICPIKIHPIFVLFVKKRQNLNLFKIIKRKGENGLFMNVQNARFSFGYRLKIQALSIIKGPIL